jgi:nicotinate dehydrogenase subunit B
VLLLEAAGQIQVEGVWATVHAGRLVHLHGARKQIEGGIQQAVSWTLFEEVELRR